MSMSTPDARMRSKVSLNPSRHSSSLPAGLLPQLLLSNVLLVISLNAGREWLLSTDVGVFWVLMRVLGCGSVGVVLWEGWTGRLRSRRSIDWSVLGIASFFLFVQQACLMIALFRLSTIKVIMFTAFSSFWMDAILSFSTRRTLFVTLAIIFSSLSDTGFSLSLSDWKAALPGLTALVGHGLATKSLDHTQLILVPAIGQASTTVATTLGATMVAVPFYVFRATLFPVSSATHVPLFAHLALPALAYTFLILSPATHYSLRTVATPSRHFGLAYPLAHAGAAIIGPLAFSHFPSWADLVTATLLYHGMRPDESETLGSPPRTPVTKLIKSYLKTILSNPESRQIFYFLILNLCFMGVQMLYGIWTNSLGLISDAIHMAFDCMAIAMGLLASIMATWPPNERFTYGYGRIETLSGFANGIFLILISIFIVFEAIQRILDPPEMNTNQLLLVSSLGLGVNLFGMFATGGHHHHGHSHSHGHSHGHSGHSNGIGHSGHSHSNGGPTDSPTHTHSPTIGTFQSPANHSHSHDHAHGEDAHHDHNCISDHTHSHTHTNGNSNHLHIHTHGHQKASLGNGLNSASTSSSEEGGLGSMTFSPITPNYEFGHDKHYDTHHSEHVPNLHDHSHVHDHHEGRSHNMRGVFLHVMADTLGSVGVIVSTLLIQYYGWTGFDPIASLFIAVLIAASVIPLVVDAGKVLCLDVSEQQRSIDTALKELSSVEGVLSYSSPRFWPKDSSSLIGSIHIQVSPPDYPDLDSSHQSSRTSIDSIVERADSLLRARVTGLEELTIQVDGPSPYS